MLRTISKIVVFASLLSPAARAALKFEKTEIEVSAPLEATKVNATFSFVNDGTHTVQIKQISTSCGCTIATCIKTTVEPGERGKIEATFQVGKHLGDTQKIITVFTDLPAQRTVDLSLRAHLPRLAAIEPTSVLWHIDDALDGKTVKVSVDDATPFRVTAVRSSNVDFAANFRAIQDSKLYEIVVIPRQSAERASATISVEGDLRNTGVHKVLIFPVFVIKRASQ